MTTRIWALGAPDPEMQAIERLLSDAGEDVVYATADGRRVHPGSAYRADPLDATHWVECAPVGGHRDDATIIDHHRPGDPGYGQPPAEFMAASSIGQVLAIFLWGSDQDGLPTFVVQEGKWVAAYGNETFFVPKGLALTAAADHCLGAAYRGECPGVDPDDLMRWRAESRAAFQQRAVAEVLADVDATIAALWSAPVLTLAEGVCVQDMRRDPPWPELPEAALRVGIAYVSGPLTGPDGRRKITCSGLPWHVKAFLAHWAPKQGLVDLYGDPARGFAGGYEQ